MVFVKVEALVADADAGLELTLLAGRTGLGRKITVPRIQKPGLALAGYTEQVHPERVQVLGNTELGYLSQLTPEHRRAGLLNLVALEPACLVITRGVEAPEDLRALCEAKEVT